MKKKLVRTVLFVSFSLLLLTCGLSVNAFDYTKIDVYTSMDLEGYGMYPIENGTTLDTNMYIIAYHFGNMTLLRNSIIEKNDTFFMSFEVYQYDNITIITDYSCFMFFISDVTDQPLDQDRQDLGNKDFYRKIGRAEVFISLVIGCILAFVAGYIYFRRR